MGEGSGREHVPTRGPGGERRDELSAWRQSPLTGRDRDVHGHQGERLYVPPPAEMTWLEGVDELPAGDVVVTRIPLGPGAWLVIGDMTAAGRQRIETAPGNVDPLIVDVRDGWFRLRLEGPGAADILQSGVDLDLHPAAWPPGRGAPTAYREIPIILYARAADCFEVCTPRSYARCLWDWLADAVAAPGGV